MNTIKTNKYEWKFGDYIKEENFIPKYYASNGTKQYYCYFCPISKIAQFEEIE